MRTRSFSFRLSSVLLSSLALAACGESDLPYTEEFPEPLAVEPEETERLAQTVDPAQLARYRSAMLTAVNMARATARKCGTTSYAAVPALKANSKLDTSSQAHAVDMVTKNFFSHTGSNGSQPWDRMKRAGYSYSAAGENIAAGNSTVDATMTQWLNSPGHCANIMSRNFTELGVGYDYGATTRYKHYWVQNFGKPL